MPTNQLDDIRMIQHMRVLMKDADPDNQSLDPGQALTLLNEAYFDYMAKIDKSVVSLGSVTATPTGVEWKPSGALPRKILRAEDVAGPIERMEIHALRELAKWGAPGFSASTGPTVWAIEEKSGGDPSWTVYAQPAATVTLYGTRNPEPLTGLGAKPAVTEPEAYWIAHLAAIRGATLLMKPQEIVDGLLRDLPDSLEAALGISYQYLKPRATPRKEPA